MPLVTTQARIVHYAVKHTPPHTSDGWRHTTKTCRSIKDSCIAQRHVGTHRQAERKHSEAISRCDEPLSYIVTLSQRCFKYLNPLPVQTATWKVVQGCFQFKPLMIKLSIFYLILKSD